MLDHMDPTAAVVAALLVLIAVTSGLIVWAWRRYGGLW
jgi:hypothetical protein